MARRLKYLLLPLLGMLMLSGCMKDRDLYKYSDYRKLSLSKLQTIQSGGYFLHGNGLTSYHFYVWFCENNRYIILADGTGRKRGSYQIDLAHNQIIFDGDNVDNKDKVLHGVMKVAGGYFEQEGTYIIGGNIQEGTNDLEQIRNSKACDPDSDSSYGPRD